MRYFHCTSREVAEAAYLPQVFGKTYAPFGNLTLRPSARLSTRGTDLLEVDQEPLAIHPESTGWAFLSRAEAQLYTALDGMTFGGLMEWFGDHREALDFTAHLWRRGLIALDGIRAVDDTMFQDGANYKEGHLVELLVTEKCNLACPYCLAGANQSMPAMDEGMAYRTVDLAFAMEDAPILAFEFAGGEPFLKYPLMKNLVTYIRNHPSYSARKVFLSIQTNGTLLTKERVQWLRDNDIRIGVSIDGGAQTQNASRPQVNGKESFSRLKTGIELLKAGGVPFGGLVVLNRANIGDPDGLMDFMLEHGIHGFRINPVAFLGDARKNWETVGLSQDEIIHFFQHFIKSVVGRGKLIKEDNVHSMLHFLTSMQRRTRCMRSDCGAGDTFQSVTANGDIYPCGRSTQSPGLRLGNIFDEGITSLSAPAQQSPRIAEIRTRKAANFVECSGCSFRQLCQAGCPAQAWERYGTVRQKTPECAFYKTLYPWLMRWLSFDENAFNHLNQCSYLDAPGHLFQREFVTAPALAERPLPLSRTIAISPAS